ncbi:Gfo/Idh/MocA family oxidoreductase [Paenibacillus sp. MMS20-IR301]|uniref:Gfo/Idh/MocA family protein n=1 Tax=Paenibacillus sp. MMS20-IR301 TaxID=2895946 RepID=UPI0028E27E81|nr:Gfo/Idh/MocA family oxidoreductase [Paenibacillus sp. MMS20-IR301]WNS45042.1 Gfo/Idh/MocA family oxidoreductase [Paenibacillus sp. MMS20-IR301]
MNIGILGTGFGAYHATLLKQMEFVDRVIVFGRNEGKLLKLQEELGVEITLSIEDILSDPAIDVVDICLPSALHKIYAVEALKSGKHVFCETPVALNLEDARDMLQAEQQYGRRILVNQFIKYEYAHQVLYEAARGATYGKLLHLTLRRETAPVWGDLGLGSIAANLMIHELDFIEWLLDAPALSAVWGTSGGKDGQALVHASFQQPELSAQVIVSSQLPGSHPFTVSYEAYFEQAKLIFHETSNEVGETTATLTSYTAAGKEEIPLSPVNSYEQSLRHALLSLQHGTVSIQSMLHAQKSLETALKLTEQLAKKVHS